MQAECFHLVLPVPESLKQHEATLQPARGISAGSDCCHAAAVTDCSMISWNIMSSGDLPCVFSYSGTGLVRSFKILKTFEDAKIN